MAKTEEKLTELIRVVNRLIIQVETLTNIQEELRRTINNLE